MSAKLLFDHDRNCWVIKDSPHGPAGSAVVNLGGLLIAVDVADGHLVEVLMKFGVGARLSDADAELLGALFSQTLPSRLSSAQTQESYEVQLVTGPTWEAVRSLAQGLLLQSIRPTERRLVALDVALHAQRAGYPATDLLNTASWEALPALTALAQLVRRHPQLLQHLSASAVMALRERAGVVTAVLAADGLAERSPVASSQLAELAHSPEHETVSGFAPDYQFVVAPESSTMPNRVTPREVVGFDWSTLTTDLALRIGPRAVALLDGARCVAHGRIPGQVVVRIPLRAGASENDTTGISIRLLTRRGELLTRAPLQLDSSEIDLPLALAKLTVDRMGAEVQRVSDGDHVFVDLALDALPDLDSEAIAGLTRGQGFRVGQRAVAARNEGRRLDSVELWKQAARLFELADEHELAFQATAHADAAFSAESTPEWRAQVIEAVDILARRILADDDPAEQDELSHLDLELSMIAGATPTLAAIHARLGGQPNLRVDNAESETERSAHLAEAIRILRILGDPASLAHARVLSKESMLD